MENPPGDATEHEPACARVAALFRRRWLRSYVRGKLRNDRIYPTAFELFRGSPEPILDVGCGVGLLGFYLRERGWSQPLLGLDLDARKIREGKTIAASRYKDVDLRDQDVQKPLPEFSGNIALFDVLHYLPLVEQSILLAHLAKCVAPGGLLVIRDCPRDNSARFWMTLLAEKFAQTISWNLNTPLHFPSRALLHEAFSEDEFESESRPLWGTSPFNNHIFIFRRRVPNL
jgi:2-polyprenyl-3-methyl-5-hydroxy-6-metoxy-1,4-benzoquinol methylase